MKYIPYKRGVLRTSFPLWGVTVLSGIQRDIHCILINLPLRAKTYISHDPKDACFGAISYTKTVWPDPSLTLLEYTPNKLKQHLSKLYTAPTPKDTPPPAATSSFFQIGNIAHILPETSIPHTFKS